MLNSVLYNQFDEKWQDRRFVVKIFFVLLYALLMPFWAIAYLVTSENILHRKLTTPLAKFISHMISFFWFLSILILSSVQDRLGVSLDEISPIGKLS